jgi:hypothetical protein
MMGVVEIRCTEQKTRKVSLTFDPRVEATK